MAALYATSSLELLAAAYFVYRRKPHAHLHKDFAAGCIFVVVWLLSLFIFQRLDDPRVLIWVGRVNFASVLFVVLFALVFVQRLAGVEPGAGFPYWSEPHSSRR